MTVCVSVIIPVYQRDAELTTCLQALAAQSLPRDQFEVIIVDRGTDQSTQLIAEQFNARHIQQTGRGMSNARNIGLTAAQGKWIAFTDADCIPSRQWLKFLSEAVSRENVWGAAGKTVGHASRSNAARFVDLTGGLDAEKYLAHPQYPWAPTCNVMYRRSVLDTAGGFDERYANFEYCDLHQRLRQTDVGAFRYEPRALVLHQHRATWRAYWQQQYGYGRGYGQFLWKHRDHFRWTVRRELKAWRQLADSSIGALWPGGDDRALMRRGTFIKQLAQHLGFINTYYNRSERARWSYE